MTVRCGAIAVSMFASPREGCRFSAQREQAFLCGARPAVGGSVLQSQNKANAVFFCYDVFLKDAD